MTLRQFVGLHYACAQKSSVFPPLGPPHRSDSRHMEVKHFLTFVGNFSVV